ncbi:MAG: helix-turn-helix transcriptional regulator [Opitutaceae bacterium]|nr:helix-turn-helix transcriptional regulator [Opitutaceae bacterium]
MTFDAYALGAILRKRRETLGLSRDTVVNRANGKICATTIHEIEHGRAPQLTTLAVICEALNITLAELFAEAEREAGA